MIRRRSEVRAAAVRREAEAAIVALGDDELSAVAGASFGLLAAAFSEVLKNISAGISNAARKG